MRMPYRIRFKKSVTKFYQNANKPLARKIERCLEILEKTPKQHPNIKALRGNLKGKYRYKIGQHRVIYAVNEQDVEVIVIKISPRGSAYS